MSFRDRAVIASFVCLCLFAALAPSEAQFSGGGGGISQAQLDAAVAPLAPMTSLPTPSPTVPSGPNGLGVTATNNQFVPSGAAQRQGVMRTNVNTDASGNWSITWGNGFSFISSTPTVVVEAGNPSGSNGIICNWRTRSATGANGFCQQTNTALVSLLGITITVAPTTPSTGTPISVVMAEPTQ